MSDQAQKQRDQEAAEALAANSTPDKEQDRVNSDDAAVMEGAHASRKTEQNIPRWRQIEIMRERAQLRKALADLDDDFDEFDELEQEVFGSESENEELYQHGGPEEEADELDDDALDEDDFDDDLDDDPDAGDFEDFDED